MRDIPCILVNQTCDKYRVEHQQVCVISATGGLLHADRSLEWILQLQ